VITRIRIEASEQSRDKVEQELLTAAERARDEYGGRWKFEHDLDVQTTRDGFWGRLTMVRMP
jgi:hypothetical protein